ncbi:MAG: hypothetical protein CVU72_06225, partial [Deltaproteobacteria bacterium HGW-Deltaproteobacteria-7]
MEVSSVILKYFSRLKTKLPGGNLSKVLTDDELLRSELFSSKQMRRHGRTIAGAHKLSVGRTSNQLLRRLTDNEGVLFEVRNI